MWSAATAASLPRPRAARNARSSLSITTTRPGGIRVIDVRRGWDAAAGEVEPKSRNGRRRVPIPGVLRDYLIERRIGADPRSRVFESD